MPVIERAYGIQVTQNKEKAGKKSASIDCQRRPFG